MERDEVRRVMTAQFYQSLSESGVQVTAVPQDQLQAIINAQADSIFAVLEAISDTDVNLVHTPAPAAMAAPLAPSEEDESVIWSGRPYLTIGIRYELTSQRLRVIRGILGRSVEEVELVRVRDTKAKQHTGERLLNVGDVTIVSNDVSTPEYVLHNVKEPFEVRELIRKATLAEKQRRGMHYREEM